MSDAKLRDLERRWKETGSIEDEAAYLLERVRVGDLTREKLELAAFCGHEGAAHASGRPANRRRLERWIRGLVPFGPAVVVSAAFAALHTAASESEGIGLIAIAARAAREWLQCPCEQHRTQAEMAALSAFDAGLGGEGAAPLERGSLSLLYAVSWIESDPKRGARHATNAIACFSTAAGHDLRDVVARRLAHSDLALGAAAGSSP